MGQAAARGTFEQRKALAILRNAKLSLRNTLARKIERTVVLFAIVVIIVAVLSEV